MLRFIALSGTTGVTENLYIYEQNGEMILLDCGIGFPDLEMPGVDLVLPDYSYVVKNKNKLKGIVVSQGHEDHIGALPFLLREVNAPIWAPPLVSEFIKDKFKDYGVKNFKIHSFNPDRDTFDVGSFKFQPFRVTHSIPDTVGFAIDTSEGRVFHVPEHKMDQNPVDGKSFDIGRARELAKNVLFLASDCLGANKKGFVGSELPIEEKMLEIVRGAKQAVYLTAISSNIGRFQQMINIAKKTGRKVVFVGRSIQKKAEMAYNLGYLKYSQSEIISFKETQNLRPNQILYIVSGCFGQVGSSVYRISLGEHDKVNINSGDTFIFSADPAPAYSKESEDFVIDNLIDRGVDVHYYDLKEGLYVSGHGGQEDIKKLFEIVKPKYFIPIGGTIRFMHSYGKLVESIGVDVKTKLFKLKAGESVVFNSGNGVRGETVPTKDVLVHGLGIGDIGKVVLEDRATLGNEGVVVVILKLDARKKFLRDIEIVSRGFVYEKRDRSIIDNAKDGLLKQLKIRNNLQIREMKEESIRFLEKHFFKVTGRSPMILPIIIEI